MGAVRLDLAAAGEGDETVDGDGGRPGRLEDVDGFIVVGSRRRARVAQDAAVKDERAGIVGDVAATDGGILADIGEGRDGQDASADDGGTGVVVEPGEGLRTASILDEGERAGGLVDQSVERAVTVAIAEAEDRRSRVGIDHRARAGEGADEDARSGDGGVPRRGRGTRGVKVENRALAEGDVGIGAEGGGRARELDGALIDVRGTGVGVGAGDDEQAGARLGERTRAAGDQRGDGQGVGAVGAGRGDDDFGGGSAQGAAREGGRTGAIIKEDAARGVGQDAAQRKRLGTSEFQGVDGFRAGHGQIGGGEVVGGGRETGGRERSIRRERGGGGADGEPVGATEGGPAADDAIGAGRGRAEGDRAAGQGDVEGRTRAAGGEGGESQRGGAAAGRDGLDRSLAGRGRQRAEGLGAGGSGGAFITQDAAGGEAERVDVEDDRAGVREDVDVAADFAELEHAVRDGGGAGQGIVRGRGEHPGAHAHLLERGKESTVVGDDRGDGVVGRARSADPEGLGNGVRGGDIAGQHQRARAAGHEHRNRVSALSGQKDGLGERLAGTGVDEGSGLVSAGAATAEIDRRGVRESPDAADLEGATHDVDRTACGASGAEHGQVTLVFLREGVGRGGVGLEEVTGDEGVAVAANVEASGGAVALTPEIGVEGEQPVAVVVDAGVVAAAAADEVVEAGERGAEAVTAVEVEPGVTTGCVEVAESERPADGRTVQGMVDQEGAVRVVADVDVLLGEAIQDVAADFESTVVEVDRETTGIQAERAGGGHADGTAVDTDAGGVGILVVLQPERRAVDQADLDDTILGVVVIVDLAGDDRVAVAVEDHLVAGAEVHVAAERRDAGHGGEAGGNGRAAEAEGAGEVDVADGDEAAGAVEGARSAARHADRATEGEAADQVRRLDDERAAGVAGAAGVAPAADQDGSRARAELRGVGDDDGAALDEDPAVQGIGDVGQHQRAIARLDEARRARELRVDRHARTEVDAQGRRRRTRRCGERQTESVQGVIIARGVGEAGEDEAAERDVLAERDRGAGTGEVRDIIGGKREVRRGVRAADRGRRAGVHPVRLAGARPRAGAAGAGDVAVGVPEQVGGAGGTRRADGEERRGDHEGGAGERDTRLRTFH